MNVFGVAALGLVVTLSAGGNPSTQRAVDPTPASVAVFDVVVPNGRLREGQRARVWLFLPARTVNYKEWELWVGKTDGAVANGTLEQISTTRAVDVGLLERGTWQIVARLCDDGGVCREIKRAEVVVDRSRFTEAGEAALGPAIGTVLVAIVSLCAFFGGRLLEVRIRRSEVKRWYIGRLAACERQLHDGGNLVIPQVMMNPEGTPWVTVLIKEPYVSATERLIAIGRRLDGGGIVPSDAALRIAKVREDLTGRKGK